MNLKTLRPPNIARKRLAHRPPRYLEYDLNADLLAVTLARNLGVRLGCAVWVPWLGTCVCAPQAPTCGRQAGVSWGFFILIHYMAELVVPSSSPLLA
jgi:hypothetical protein